MTPPPVSVATLPVVRALLDEARHKNYLTGTLGIRARPEWAGPEAFEHVGVPVTVVPCISALAVREALRERGDDRWLVILTDREDTDLGAGIRSHLVWHRLRTPDPWAAVQGRFAATALDPALTTVSGHREIAAGLLACTPVDGGWPPAPGGVLTRDHALGAVARHSLRLVDSEAGGRDAQPRDSELSQGAVLAWTAQPGTTTLIADLRSLAGDALTDSVLDWVTRRAGPAGPSLLQLLRNGQGRQIVPLGLILSTLLEARTESNADLVVLARESLVRLEPRTGGTVSQGALMSWAAESTHLVGGQLRDRNSHQRGLAERLLVEADGLLGDVHGVALAECSDLLPSGLTARFARVADLVRTSMSPTDIVDQPAVTADRMAAVEAAWLPVERHLLSVDDPRVPALLAAVRLTRWLASDTSAPEQDLGSLHSRHVAIDSWVDSAVNDAAPGVGDGALGAALSAVLTEVRRRRDRHDTEFAAALAVSTGDDGRAALAPPAAAIPLEDLLATVVLPLAKKAPLLLLVLDGMSAAVGGEVVMSIVERVADGWSEYLPAGQAHRIGALSLLPSLTEVSRASLLCGELRTGGQDVEQRGYADLVRAHGLAGARLFHKKSLDSSQLGFAVAHEVGAALDDTAGQPLVTCVLNTIDDALDRSDPAGTVWTAETVKHLRPLLDRARLAGRVVVLTADHGHIVERRQGRQRSYPVISSGRSRATGPLGDGEVLVTGRRVLLHDGRAVLAVDERLRYGPLKAGYHGGAAPAEVVVPLYVLVSGGQVGTTGLVPAAPQEPSWWLGPAASTSTVVTAPVVAVAPARRRPKNPTLFDQVESAAATPVGPMSPVSPVAAAAVGSPTYADQRRLAGRASVTDRQVQSLLEALLAAPARRLAPAPASVALGVASSALRGAVLHAQRLLNVEGYPVLSLDVDGATVILDETLLREQFELR